ncbi:hypothetical protein MtrunA17_Chr7g0246471 [Medicago truncatula]|uniref:Uncharacterized protein n=1 Tax=Medicago truncatula TaxID=3880 RepID=I3SU01_MEDTR|nr:unknown [Medicago truncatula]RHN46836.1 hypothetical protein MtrunA17_Chr7g0246471 [Medicago truncatula]
MIFHYCHVTAIGLLTLYLPDTQMIDPNDELPVTLAFPTAKNVTL